jgi:hypothetical protein
MSDYRIVTGKQPGFKEGENLYSIGMKATDFGNRFGKPEFKTRWSYLYPDYGIRIYFEKNVVERFTFHLNARTSSEENGDGDLESVKIFPASIETDGGVCSFHDVRDVVVAHGQPTEKQRFRDRYTDETKVYLFYDWGQFKFIDGSMDELEIVRFGAYDEE